MIETVMMSLAHVCQAPVGFEGKPRVEEALHALPDGSPDRSVASNRWIEVRESQRLVGSFSNGLRTPTPTAWRVYGKDEVSLNASGSLPVGSEPFTIPEPATPRLGSQLKTFLYITRDPLPAMTTKNVYQVISERIEVEFRRKGTQEAYRFRTTWRTIGFREELVPLTQQGKSD